MYNLPYFIERDQAEIRNFIDQHPFAFLTGSRADGTQAATQIPILTEEKNGELFLQGHFMRNTDHHKAFEENNQVLAVFSGANAYISANWYSNPYSGSSWNYMSVHISGNMRFMSEEELIVFMRKLTLKFENGNTDLPTYFDNLTEDYRKRLLPGILGFEIKADSVNAIFKLSQNQDEESYRNIIHELEKRGGNDRLIADAMKKKLPELFPEENRKS